jgi:transposase
MGAAQFRVQGIQRLHMAGLSYKTIASELKCSYKTIAEALHSTDSESLPIERGPKKITRPKISRYIEMLSLMDSLLTNDQINAKAQEHDSRLTGESQLQVSTDDQRRFLTRSEISAP